jgi:hypothetical protein
MLCEKFETAMFTCRIPAVGREHQPNGRKIVAVLVGDLRAVLEQDRQALWVLRFTRTPDGDEQIARLMLQLIEIRPDGKVAGGHNEPP